MSNGQANQANAGPIIQVAESGTALFGGNGDDILFAESQTWTAQLQPLNNSGVQGTATFSLEGDQLMVRVEATGLEPNQPHPMHIHGLTDDTTGAPLDSNVAPTTLDADGDGFVELAEGRPAAGPPILTLANEDGSFPTAADGTITYERSFSLTDLSVEQGFETADLFPLVTRIAEIHGRSVEAGAGQGTAGEVDGSGGYKALLPVAAAEITLEPVTAGDAQAQDAPQDTPLFGGNGSDRLIGGRGDDLLAGGRGDDVLDGGRGDDDLAGGLGADTYVTSEGDDVVVGFRAAEGDRIVLAADVDAAQVTSRQVSQGTMLEWGDDQSSLLLVGVNNASAAQVQDWIA